MLKSFMSYFDILFPINLGPLTYRCPEALKETAQPGMLVSAPLKNKLTKGIIFSRCTSPPADRIKEFTKIHLDAPVLGNGLLKIIRWISEYYIAQEGLVLKHTVPKEVFVKTSAKKTHQKSSHNIHVELIDIPEKDISPLIKSISNNRYQTFLVHSPSVIYEYSIVAKLLTSSKNVIILLPEISRANLFYNSVKGIFKERICLLHGEISRGRRSEYIEGIVSGKHDIVVGTRAPLFAPLKKLSLIIVLNEHSSFYKQEEGVRYNIRDVAVMRGFIEKATVLLSSITPSVDSYFNVLANKYRFIKPQYNPGRPRIKIIDMRFEKAIKPNVTRSVFEVSRSRLRDGKNIMFVINRRGYAPLLLCRECGYTENCSVCSIPLVLHKHDRSLKCHYCGLSGDMPERCSRCGSYQLESLGSGTERLQEDIEGLFGIKPIRFDSDRAKRKSEIEELMQKISSESTRVIIGTKMMTKRIGITKKFPLAVILNIDNSLNFPDFRASEKAYMDLSAISELVEPDGEILLQTRLPKNHLFRCFKSNDYVSFINEELSVRKALNYPPYSKLLKINFSGSFDLAEKMKKIINDQSQNIEVLGPINIKRRKSGDQLSVLLKSNNRKTLNTAARTILSKYEKVKDINIRIDVDPV